MKVYCHSNYQSVHITWDCGFPPLPVELIENVYTGAWIDGNHPPKYPAKTGFYISTRKSTQDHAFLDFANIPFFHRAADQYFDGVGRNPAVIPWRIQRPVIADLCLQLGGKEKGFDYMLLSIPWDNLIIFVEALGRSLGNQSATGLTKGGADQ